MLRRRILASAMASVMALTSVAIVANADETSTNNVKTKAELDELINKTYGEDYRTNKIYDYGTVASRDMTAALEYADNVLADADSTPKDYTVAYEMVVAVEKKMVPYNSTDLKNLINKCKPVYDSDNIRNEELNDLIYDETKFGTFVEKYNDAVSYSETDDIRLTTDAWLDLNDAYEAVLASKLTTVSKSDFRAALKNYESVVVAHLNDYDSWRRGDAGWVDGLTDGYWIFQSYLGNSDSNIPFEALVDVVYNKGQVTEKKTFTAFQSVVDWTERDGEADVLDYINAGYKTLDSIKNLSETTDEDILKAYNVALKAVEIFKSWSADSTERATEAQVTKLLNQYHNQLVGEYATTTAEKLFKEVTGESSAPSGWQDADHQYAGVELKSTVKGEVKLDKDGYWVGQTGGDVAKTVNVAKNSDLLKYIKVEADDVDSIGTTDDKDVAVQTALEVAETYFAEKAKNNKYADLTLDTIKDLDENNTISKATGSVQEWTIIYRALYYALKDEFNGSTSSNTTTRSDVSKYINSNGYDTVVDATNEAPVFKTVHDAFVAVRQDAVAWLREANKDKTHTADSVYDFGGADKNATEVLTALKNAYDKMKAAYDDYKYSYGEIHKAIGDTYEKLDDGELEVNDTLLAALEKTAYCLSVVDATDDDNEAFTDDRTFNENNRLYTASGANSSEAALKAAYEALLAAQTKKTVLLGDIDESGEVDIYDAKKLLDLVVAGNLPEASVGDFDQDGDVDIDDAKAILDYAVNKALNS
jgi:uncharacterized protein (DUF433 family)